MKYIETILQELQSLSMNALIQIILIFAVFYWLSKKFQRPFFRIVIILISFFLIINVEKGSIIVNIAIIIGVAILIPHIPFIFSTITNILYSIKMMTSNTYFFFVSIYYKIIRFFNWIINIFLTIKGFFFRAKKEESSSNSNHEQKEYSYEKNESSSSSNNSYSNYEKDNRKQRQYEDFRNSNSNNEYSSYENNESNQSYESNETYEKVEDNENISDEFKRFYSSSAYIILGVSENDDFSHIKKSYRALVSIYHPDRNLDEIELYTEITQNINSAYDKLKKIKGR